MKSLRLIIYLLAFTTSVKAQNETHKWYFGNKCAVDFSVALPVSLNNSAMFADEGCASIADANGNLLFYTNGRRIWNASHQIMANGDSLAGGLSSTQSSLILRKPLSATMYYVFTTDQSNSTGDFRYSVVDMALAAGSGSVIQKNTLIFSPVEEKLSATLHCNQQDSWILCHDRGSDTFRAYLLTASGMNTTAVISNQGSSHSNVPAAAAGQMKFNVQGTRVAATIASPPGVEVFDFNNQTGALTNGYSLSVNYTSAYGCEFSSDGSRLYASGWTNDLLQWDLCANSPSAVAASQAVISQSVPSPLPVFITGLQLGPDEKIYGALQTVGNYTPQFLSVIHNPNMAGSNCNFVIQGLALSSGTCSSGLPNFSSSIMRYTPPLFDYSVACSTSSFIIPPSLCPLATRSVTSVKWLFGDPGSGSLNSSTLTSPTHIYPAAGTFTAGLVRYYNCGSDTAWKQVVINNPVTTLSVSGTFTVCKNDVATFSVSGAHTYSWSSGQRAATVQLMPTSHSTYTVTGTDTITGCSNHKIFDVIVETCTFVDLNSTSHYKIYPNPVKEVLHIESEEAFVLSLTNQLGEVFIHYRLSPGSHTINLDQLNSGIYLIKTESPSRNYSRKIVINKQ